MGRSWNLRDSQGWGSQLKLQKPSPGIRGPRYIWRPESRQDEREPARWPVMSCPPSFHQSGCPKAASHPAPSASHTSGYTPRGGSPKRSCVVRCREWMQSGCKALGLKTKELGRSLNVKQWEPFSLPSEVPKTLTSRLNAASKEPGGIFSGEPKSHGSTPPWCPHDHCFLDSHSCSPSCTAPESVYWVSNIG